MIKSKGGQSVTKTETPGPGGEPPAGIAGVILCGGSGTRMGRTRSHKVCVPIAGRPAVVRLIDTLRAEGVDPLVVVVGDRAGDVVETIGSAHPGVHFVYQRDRLGTGHAARIGIEALGQFGYQGPVLVTMGDKWFGPGLVADARRKLVAARADLLLVTTPKRPESGAGRLVNLPGHGIVGIVERRDIERARVLEDWLELASSKANMTKGVLRGAGLKRIRPATKLWRALGPLASFCRGSGTVQASELTQVLHETGLTISIGDTSLTPEKVERRSATVNESVYVGDISLLQSALLRVGRANAQDEYYLTDVVEIMARSPDPARSDHRHRIIEYRLDPEQVMAFNTRGELRRIEEHVRKLEQDAPGTGADQRLARELRTPAQWFDLLDPGSRRGRRLIERAYGWGGPLVNGRCAAVRSVVRLFARAHGHDRKLLIVRAPGRINLMGRHIDHQGGFVHAMALDCEIIMAASPRNDDVIRMVNADPVAFPSRELVIGDWRPALRTPDWLGFVDGSAVRTHLMSTAGDWSNYVLAAALYQQFHHPRRRIRGMNLAVSGNVPMAAGLSSSSSLVVAAMEAITAINGIGVSGPDLVSACGEAEWFVGSRGGAADHAAIRLGRAGHAAKMGFHPFRLDSYVPVSPEAALLIAYSGELAIKSAGARDRFNERVACYRLGILLLKRDHPRLASRIEHIRDLAPNRLGVGPEKVLDMINHLPERITRRQLRSRLRPKFSDHLDQVFSSHGDPGTYTIRDVVAYGVGECERSRIAANHLGRNDLAAFGELMLLSHDGDRVSGSPAFAADARPDRDGSAPALHRLIGAYACSTANIDRMVDIARSVPGVYGAQLAGAGLGGCVMILARRTAAAKVKSALASQYYRPLGMAPSLWHVRSVSGGGIVRP